MKKLHLVEPGIPEPLPNYVLDSLRRAHLDVQQRLSGRGTELVLRLKYDGAARFRRSTLEREIVEGLD